MKKALYFISAYSGKEARDMLIKHPDTNVMLLDVVMEEEDSGLQLVKTIREELKNSILRIILRTGEPRKAPEKQIFLEYDI